MTNKWEFWVILYLIFSVLFAQTYKRANRKMKDAGALTILTELFTALFAILFIPFFEMKFPSNINIYLILLIVSVIYSITDRLNMEARYGLNPSTFSMLKQLSTVFMILFGFIFLKEKILVNRIIGAVIIILANLYLTFDKGKLNINKYFIMSVIANLLFAIAMLINVNISDNFNLAIYTIFTVFIPSIFIFIFGRYNFKKLSKEFKLYNKKYFIISTFSWCVMLISSVKAYQLGNITVVAPLFALTSILNAFFEYLVDHNKKALVKKLTAAILLVIGVILVKL